MTIHRNNSIDNKKEVADHYRKEAFELQQKHQQQQQQQVPISASLTPTALPTDSLVQVATNHKPKMPFTLRRAEASDVDDILRFVLGQLTYQIRLIEGLAKYEKEPNAVELTREDLLRDGFGPQPLFHCFLAEIEEENEQGVKALKTVGMALYYFTYSTWQGRVLYLEDIFIDEEYRRNGIGSAFFKILAQEAKKTNCSRFQWQVLDWNAPSIAFYKKIGAHEKKEWITMRMYRDDIDNFLDS